MRRRVSHRKCVTYATSPVCVVPKEAMANEKATCESVIMAGLANCGIEDIAEVELSFHIFPMNEWGGTIKDTDPIFLTFE